jgi:uncharacterized membrane protein YccC
MITFSTATNLLPAVGDSTKPSSRKRRINEYAGKNGLVMKGLGVRPTLPDIGAVVRSLLGVLIVAGAALHWGGPGAATAAAGAAAIAGAVALQDSPRGQFWLVVCVSLAMGVAVLLAASFAPYGLVFADLVAVWCFGAGMAWAVSANAGLVAAAAAGLLVVTPPAVPAWPNAATAAALAVLGGFVQALLIASWPRRRWRVQRSALSRAYLSLAADARAMADDPTRHVDPEPLIALRDAFTLTDGQAARRPVAYRTWYGLPERISVTVTAIAGKSIGAKNLSQVLVAAADVLAAIAEPSPARRRAAAYALGRFDATVVAMTVPESALVQRFSGQLREAIGLRYGELAPSSELTELRRAGLPGELRGMAAAVRSELTWESPVLRHAMRLSVAAAAGATIARFADLEHGYWIPLTVVMVLRPETAHTYTRCVGRVAGNALGILVASILIVLLHPSGVLAAMMAVVFIAVAYAVSGFGYLALSAALAAAIVFLVDIGGTAVAATVSDRLLATLIGGALAVLAHVALPDHAVVRLRQRAGELLKTEIDYAATVIKAFVHELDRPTEALSAAWERAYRARAAFEAAAGSGPTDDGDIRRWLRSYRTALNVVTASCTALETSLPARPPATWDRDFVGAVDDYVQAMCGDPVTPGAPWSADVDQLTVAADRVRVALPSSDAATARLLVAEIGTITNQLATITAGTERLPHSP